MLLILVGSQCCEQASERSQSLDIREAKNNSKENALS